MIIVYCIIEKRPLFFGLYDRVDMLFDSNGARQMRAYGILSHAQVNRQQLGHGFIESKPHSMGRSHSSIFVKSRVKKQKMEESKCKRKYVSIEPINDFDFDPFVRMIENITPEHVAVGYDNWNNRLPESPLLKTMKFIDELNTFTKVRTRKLREACSR
jgi:hypothetical protein